MSKIKETLLIDAEYFQALLAAISQAKKTIDLEVYIFANDELGRKVAHALIEAAKRKVKVRVLVDGMGSPHWYHTFAPMLEHAGIESRVYQPLPWLSRHWIERQKQKGFFKKIIYLLFRINRRNHRKTCVIDQKIVFVGSANITMNHLAKDASIYEWHDTSICLENVDARRLKVAFENVWNHFPLYERAKYSFQHVPKNPIFRLNFSRHQRRVLFKELLNRIRKSKKQVWISNAYFMPNAQLLNRLLEAAKYGVDVKILVPHKSDIRFYPLVTRLFYSKLLNAGASIYEYTPGILHSKTIIIDHFYLIGSSNLNNRSLMHDLEVDVMISSKEVKEKLKEQYLIDLQKSEQVHQDSLQDLSKSHKFFAWLLLYLRYWL